MHVIASHFGHSYCEHLSGGGDGKANFYAVSFSHLHYNVIQRECETSYTLARNCLTYMLDYISNANENIKP